MCFTVYKYGIKNVAYAKAVNQKYVIQIQPNKKECNLGYNRGMAFWLIAITLE